MTLLETHDVLRGAVPARPALMGRLNATSILELVRDQGPISRAEIARRLRLSAATVTRLTAELIERGQIVAGSEPGASSGGRRPILLSFNHQATAVAGVDVGGTSTTAALSDLDGHILARRTISSRDRNGRPLDPAAIVELIRSVVGADRSLTPRLRGIGVGVPSIARHRDGVVVLAPALGWDNVPLAQLVRDAFQVPAFVENDVNLAALGEYSFGAGRGTKNLVVILVGTGIGAGIIINGRLHRGARETAGEIGYLMVDRSSLDRTYPGFGHLESVAGGRGIAERARQRLGTASPPPEGWPRDPAAITARDVFALYRRDPIATEVVDEVIDYLTIAIANVACVLNPERIVLGGGVIERNPHLVSTIGERLRGRIPDVPEIVGAELGGDAVLTGAIALARERTSGYAFVERAEVPSGG